MAESEKFTPPYGVAWDTFLNTIDKMGTEGLPSRVDRSYLSNQSGNVQTYFMQALRSFGLIEEGGAATELLKRLAQAGKDRPAVMAEMLETHFAPIIALGGQNATQGQLEETWTETFGQTGDTRRKAVRFFLAAADYSKITVSRLWKAPRSSSPSTSSNAKKPKGATKKGAARGAARAATTPSGPVSGDTYKVVLQGGGSITVTVAESHFNLSKFRSDREFVYGLVDAMTAYAEGSNQEVTVRGASEEASSV